MSSPTCQRFRHAECATGGGSGSEARRAPQRTPRLEAFRANTQPVDGIVNSLPLSPCFCHHNQLLPLLVESLGGPNANMPRLQAAAAGTLITFCNPERMSAEWLYEPMPGGGGSAGEPVGLAMLRSLSVLVTDEGGGSLVVKEEALTAVGCIAQVRGVSRGGGVVVVALLVVAVVICSRSWG